jgi:hypothetical protein
VNSFSEISTPFSHLDMDGNTKNINIFYNCLQKNVDKFLKQPIEKDMYEMKVG